jgi:hypothetical protein
MAHYGCPPWIGYLLLAPIRRWLEKPQKMLAVLSRRARRWPTDM